jgi:acyl-coenzyme A thioesterase PaaI-like protein
MEDNAMGEKRLGDRERRAVAAAVADDLRAVVADLSERDVSDGDLEAAAELAQSLRQRLDGPRRARWYEGDAMALGDRDRFAYLDQSPIRGRLNPIAPPLDLEIVESGDGNRRVEGRARLGSAYEGPPHGVHGGWVAALLDELLGTAQGLVQTKSVTAILKIRYRNITPIDEDLQFRGWIEEDRGRTVIARGTCHAGDTLTADAEGIFVRVDFNEILERMKERRDR